MDIKLSSDTCGTKDKTNNHNNRKIENLTGIGKRTIPPSDIMKQSYVLQ